MVISRFSVPESTRGNNVALFFLFIKLAFFCVNWVWVMVGGLSEGD